MAFSERKIILFNGEMGAGKTTLIKAICHELGCEDEVSSPTFSLVNHYVSPSAGDVFHFDCYRLKSTEEAMDIGFEEYLESGSYCLIEWPEIILKLISEPYVEVEVISNPTSRQINLHLS